MDAIFRVKTLNEEHIMAPHAHLKLCYLETSWRQRKLLKNYLCEFLKTPWWSIVIPAGISFRSIPVNEENPISEVYEGAHALQSPRADSVDLKILATSLYGPKGSRAAVSSIII